MNPDVVQTRTFVAIAEEITSHVLLDWSMLYAQDEDSRLELRNKVVAFIIATKPEELQISCPHLCEYMLANQRLQDWHTMAIAVDNQNGMYHPLRLTKVVAFK